MAKHLIGFGLFLSIVTFFGFAYWLLLIPPIPSLEQTNLLEEKSYPTNCYYDGPNRVGKARAIADRNTGQITIYINEFPGGSHVSLSELTAIFTFYVVHNDEVRVANVIQDSLSNSVRRDNETKWILRYETAWVQSLAPQENLYVVPAAQYGRNGPRTSAEFSKASAIPVMIRN